MWTENPLFPYRRHRPLIMTGILENRWWDKPPGLSIRAELGRFARATRLPPGRLDKPGGLSHMRITVTVLTILADSGKLRSSG